MRCRARATAGAAPRLPCSVQRETSVPVPACAQQPVQPRGRIGQLREDAGSITSTANSGISPTIERTRSGRYGRPAVQHIVEETVLLVPERHAFAAHVGHRVGNIQEMLEKFRGDVLIDLL